MQPRGFPPGFPLVPGMPLPPGAPVLPSPPMVPGQQFPFPYLPQAPGAVPLVPGMHLPLVPGALPPRLPVLPPQMTGFPYSLAASSSSISAAPVLNGSSQVVVGAPVMRGPSSIANIVQMQTSNNMNLFNNINTNSSFINQTSDMLNKTIFCNAFAGLSLTIFVGKIRQTRSLFVLFLLNYFLFFR
jgi:hypothetical protein